MNTGNLNKPSLGKWLIYHFLLSMVPIGVALIKQEYMYHALIVAVTTFLIGLIGGLLTHSKPAKDIGKIDRQEIPRQSSSWPYLYQIIANYLLLIAVAAASAWLLIRGAILVKPFVLSTLLPWLIGVFRAGWLLSIDFLGRLSLSAFSYSALIALFICITVLSAVICINRGRWLSGITMLTEPYSIDGELRFQNKIEADSWLKAILYLLALLLILALAMYTSSVIDVLSLVSLYALIGGASSSGILIVLLVIVYRQKTISTPLFDRRTKLTLLLLILILIVCVSIIMMATYLTLMPSCEPVFRAIGIMCIASSIVPSYLRIRKKSAEAEISLELTKDKLKYLGSFPGLLLIAGIAALICPYYFCNQTGQAPGPVTTASPTPTPRTVGPIIVYPPVVSDDTEFQLYIFSQEYYWEKGTMKVKFLGEYVRDTDVISYLYNIHGDMKTQDAIICVGAASEGVEDSERGEEIRALNRSVKLLSWIRLAFKDAVKSPDLWKLNLGHYRQAPDSDNQRPIIVIGVKKLRSDLNLNELFSQNDSNKLLNRLKENRFQFKFENYSKFEFIKGS